MTALHEVKIRSGIRQATSRHTELGPLPVDWECAPLSESWTVTDCKHVTAEFVSMGLPVASIREAQSRIVDLSNANLTTEAYFERLRGGGRDPRPGDLIFTRNATVGEVAQVTADLPPFAMGQDVCLLRKRDARSSTDYLQHFLRSPLTARQLDNFMVGSTFKRVNVQQIKNIRVPLPRPEEQQLIAEYLNEIEMLIASLDALVVKKRHLKQGAMQQLLTGRMRLPGFEGEWVHKSLGELLKYEQPTKYLVRSAEYDDRALIPVLTAGKTFVLGYTDEQEGIYADLPVIIFDDFTTASRFVDFPFKAKSSAMKMLTSRDRRNDLRLIFELMQLLNFPLSDHKRYWISEYQKLTVKLPKPEEQTAIVRILLDMDNELRALEVERSKAAAVKQGMMQELLTGRIRLV